jgi:hypothetical protein
MTTDIVVGVPPTHGLETHASTECSALSTSSVTVISLSIIEIVYFFPSVPVSFQTLTDFLIVRGIWRKATLNIRAVSVWN